MDFQQSGQQQAGGSSLQDKYLKLIHKLPSVTGPVRRLSFKEKLMWSGIILLVYFVMTQIIVYGVQKEAVVNLQFLEIVLGSAFGSFVTLGIGPIVTASIILQLLVGSKIIPWNMQTQEGKSLFTGTQKILAILFALIEAFVFVSFGAVPAVPGGQWFVILQLAIGGWVILFMDEVVAKWGFGSGVSLFIVAGVAKSIVQGLVNPLTTDGSLFEAGVTAPIGSILNSVFSIGGGQIIQGLLVLIPVIATVLVIFIAIYSQSIKVEVPLAYGSMSGFGRRWPLKFFYTSNMPVILVAALLANLQLVGRMLSQTIPWLGTFDQGTGQVTGGLILFLFPPSGSAGTTLAIILISIGVFVLLGLLVAAFLKKNTNKFGLLFGVIGLIVGILIINHPSLSGLTLFSATDLIRFFTYSIFMIVGSVIFSLFWVQTSGMDSRSVAEQIEGVGMYIPGARRDVRIIEAKLKNYIPVLTVLGGAGIGMLAAFADFTGAIGTGTGILLATMIIYQMYEQITEQHMDDMHPFLRRMLGKL